MRNGYPAPDHTDISRHRAELLAILAALDAFLAQYRAVAPPSDTRPPDVETL